LIQFIPMTSGGQGEWGVLGDCPPGFTAGPGRRPLGLDAVRCWTRGYAGKGRRSAGVDPHDPGARFGASAHSTATDPPSHRPSAGNGGSADGSVNLGIATNSSVNFRHAARGETFDRNPRYPAMTQPDIWYVTFGPDRTDENATSMVRSTRKFKTEVDAKLFAMQILAKGWSASAGTLNPHQPKRIVGPAQIEQWADPG
jgi:hypothetical protein